MSSSMVHLAVAAIAGVTLGVGTTLAMRPSPSEKRTSRTEEPLLPTRPLAGAAPGAGGVGVPSKVYHGGLTTGTELAKSVMLPGAIGPISDFLIRQAYTTAYDRRNRIPAWTAEHLTAANLKSGGGDRQNSTFHEDEDVPYRFRAHLLDYFKSGYDRGHMVPAADAKQSQLAMQETFALTNIAPQVGEGFNRHYWAYLEQFCRSLTTQFEDVYVFTVPLFLPKQSPDGKWHVTYEMIAATNQAPTIAVPTHFAKVLLASRPPRNSFSSGAGAEKEWSLGAFVLPNAVIPDETRLENFIVPVEAVESSAGLTLFPDELKRLAKPLCSTVACKVVVRRFDDAQKKLTNGGGGGKKGGRERSASI